MKLLQDRTSYIWLALTIATLMLLPSLAFAQSSFPSDGGAFGDFLAEIIEFINVVIIPFILGIGFLVFVWGMFRYFIAGAANDEARANGKNLMIYATLAFVLVIIFWGVVNLLASSTGFSDTDADDIEPLVPGAPALET